jgi:hypothetical protein
LLVPAFVCLANAADVRTGDDIAKKYIIFKPTDSTNAKDSIDTIVEIVRSFNTVEPYVTTFFITNTLMLRNPHIFLSQD